MAGMFVTSLWVALSSTSDVTSFLPLLPHHGFRIDFEAVTSLLGSNFAVTSL